MTDKHGKTKDTRQPGLHLMGTIIHCDLEALMNHGGLLNLLESLPPKIQMRKINFKGNPVLQYCENNQNKNDYGFTGVCILHESHFSIHTWAAYGSVDFDVFSCNSFDTKVVLDTLEWYFRGEFVNVSTVSRGNVPSEINTLINPFEDTQLTQPLYIKESEIIEQIHQSIETEPKLKKQPLAKKKSKVKVT